MFVIDFKILTEFWEPVIQVEIRPCFEPILMAQIPSGCGSKLRGTKLLPLYHIGPRDINVDRQFQRVI